MPPVTHSHNQQLAPANNPSPTNTSSSPSPPNQPSPISEISSRLLQMELDGGQEDVALPGGIALSYYRRISRVQDDDSISQAGRPREDPTPTPRDRQPPATATEFRQPSPTPTLPESPTSDALGSNTPDINMLISTQQKLVELQT